MKQVIPILTALLFAAVSPLLLYGAETQKQATTPATSQSREQYENSMEARLKKVGKQLDELQVKAGKMAQQANKDIDRQLAEATKMQKAASGKLEELRKKSEKEWKKFTTEMNQAADDVEKAYESAKSKFK